MIEMKYCNKCLYPEIAVNLDIDDGGLCSSCFVSDEVNEITEIDWKMREKKFIQILEEQRKYSKGDLFVLWRRPLSNASFDNSSAAVARLRLSRLTPTPKSASV